MRKGLPHENQSNVLIKCWVRIKKGQPEESYRTLTVVLLHAHDQTQGLFCIIISIIFLLCFAVLFYFAQIFLLLKVQFFFLFCSAVYCVLCSA